MDAMTMQAAAAAFAWLGELVPSLIAALILLLVWEVVVLLAAILGIRSEPTEAERTRSRSGIRSGRLLNLALLCATAASSGCDIAPTEPATPSSDPPTPAFSATPGGGYTAIDLGTLGGSWSWALAISQLGDVVGMSTDATEYGHPIIWTDGVISAWRHSKTSNPHATRSSNLLSGQRSQDRKT